MSSKPEKQANQRPRVGRPNIRGLEFLSRLKVPTLGSIRKPPTLIAVIGPDNSGKTTFVNEASGSRLGIKNGLLFPTSEIQASREFMLDGRPVVLVDTPGFGEGRDDTQVLELIGEFLARSYPTGTKLTGIVNLCRIRTPNPIAEGPPPKDFRMLRELCGGAALESVLVVTIDGDLIQMSNSAWIHIQGYKAKFSQDFEAMWQYGARTYHCKGTSESAQGALKFLLKDRSDVLKIRQELINKLNQEVPESVETDNIDDIRRPEESTKKAMKRVKALQRELEEQKRRVKEEADVFKKHIAEMQYKQEVMREAMRKSKEGRQKLEEQKTQAQEEADAFKKTIDKMRNEGESMRQEMLQRCQELEEKRKRAREETDHLRKCIAEMRSKSEEDQGGSANLPLNRSSPDFGHRLNAALHGQEYEQCVQGLTKDDSVWLADYLDKALNSLDPFSPASRKCMRELRSICGTHTIFPTSYSIPSHLLAIDPHPFSPGGSGEVHHGTLDGTAVCVKRLPSSFWGVSQEAIQMFCKEAVMWKYLKHPNILPLLGATISPPQLISVFMPAGDMSKYIEENPSADRIGLLSEIAEGLHYLHSRNVIHGDLKGMNILVQVVDGTPHACIADFGIATVTRNLDSVRPATHQNAHTPIWSAPEVLRGESLSKESDIYSLAMTMIEILSGKVPFSDLKTSWVVVQAVWEGKRPPRPVHPSCKDGLWTLIQRCWDQDPRLRPEISEVSQSLSSVSAD